MSDSDWQSVWIAIGTLTVGYGGMIWWLQVQIDRLRREINKEARMTNSKGKIEIYQDSAGEWRWRVSALNGNILADSAEGYKNKSDCEHGLMLTDQILAGDDEDAE